MGHPTVNRHEAPEVTLGVVARELGIAHSTAWARVIRGDIPAELRGGRFLVERRVLDRLVAEKIARETAADSARAYA